MTRVILTMAVVGTVFVVSGCETREPLSPSIAEGPLLAHAHAAGFSYFFEDDPNIPSAVATNGDQIDIGLNTAFGQFAFHPKTVSGGGNFTITSAGGQYTGTWEATKLISFKSFGSSFFPDIGMDAFGGTLILQIALSSGQIGILKLTCTDFGNPPPGRVQGMTLQIVRGRHFTGVWPFPPVPPTAGATFFLED